MPGFDYKKYANERYYHDPDLESDILLLSTYGNNYEQLIKDVLENKVKLAAIQKIFNGDIAFASGEKMGADWTKGDPAERTKVIGTYLIGLKTADRITDWGQKYSIIGEMQLNNVLGIKSMEDMELHFDNDNYNNLSKEEKTDLFNEVKKIKEDRLEVVRATKKVYEAINNKEYHPEYVVINGPEDEVVIEKEPASENGRNIPEESAIDFNKLLDEQLLLNKMDKDDINPDAIPYMSKVNDDYMKYDSMGDGKYMRSRFDEAFNRLAKGEKIFATQPEFAIGRAGREQIINYLNSLECAQTDAFVEMYGNSTDKEQYNIANIEKADRAKTPAQLAASGFYLDGSHTEDQIESLIYNSLSYKEKYMDALGMKKLTDPAAKEPEEYKNEAIDLIKQAKAEYNGCSWLSQVFGYIFPTKAGKINDQIKFMRQDLISKGIPAAEISQLENAPEVQNQPAENNNNDNKEVNKKPAELKKEDAQVGLGENNELDKSKAVQPEKGNQLNKENIISKDQ
ncbi:MAG: hypothetical protein MJ068_04280 [Clostridia bacterium]|nr:hypothetical protein [Clostridia bacterium]